ncbi:transcriptional regulator [mine drainage metagenome]|uniref:Transcriptional regulator n=1 Tax=mine drainage metagenome TaxID=410659 RepID=T1BUI1_9ZZZZ
MEPEGNEVLPPAVSTSRKAVLLHLKRYPGAPLKEIASALGISRTAALKHLGKLETENLVVRAYESGRMGRPRVCFRLTPSAQQIFPAAYTQAALCAMSFIEKHQGRAAVVRMLEERAQELRERHRPPVCGKGPTRSSP